jgi:hypothetical protein
MEVRKVNIRESEEIERERYGEKNREVSGNGKRCKEKREKEEDGEKGK